MRRLTLSRKAMRTARIQANRFYRAVRAPSVWATLTRFEKWMVWDRLNSVGSPLANRVGAQGLDYFPCRYIMRGQRQRLDR